jgi:hypothetical protein
MLELPSNHVSAGLADGPLLTESIHTLETCTAGHACTALLWTLNCTSHICPELSLQVVGSTYHLVFHGLDDILIGGLQFCPVDCVIVEVVKLQVVVAG